MNGQFDYESAKKSGYTDAQIQAFLAQNKGVTSSQTQPQLPYNPPPQAAPSKANPLLDFLLPTAGGVVGGIAGGAAMPFGGEIAGGALGMAGGQALADYLQGKTVDQSKGDVISAGVGGAVGGVAGKALGFLGSKLLTGVGEDLASGGLNLTKSQAAKYASQFGEPIEKTLTDSGLAGANADSLEGGIRKLGQSYSKSANQDIAINPDTFLNNATKAIETLRSQAPGSAKTMATHIEQELQDNVLPKLSNDPTMATINKLKGEYDTQTTPSQFSSDPARWNVNRAIGNILRKTLNDSADEAGVVAENGQPLSALGKRLMKLHDALDMANKRVGLGSAGNLFGTTNEVLGGVGVSAAGALGANPLTGLLLPGMRIANSAVRSNPAIAGILSKGATSAGRGIADATGVLTGAGVLAGGNGAKGLFPSPTIGVSQNGENNNEQQNSQNTSPTNTLAQNGSTFKTFDGKSELPASLPPPSSIQNTIPNQPYPQEQYLKDVNTVQADLQRAGNNPLAQDMLGKELQTIEAKKAANDEYVSRYTQQSGLSADQQDFVKTAPVTYDNMNTLRSLIQTHATDGLFATALADNPAIQYIKTQQDPTGDYAKMVSLMGQLRGQAAKAIQGGRPSNFDLALYSGLDPKNSKASNLANLDQAQKTLFEQYKQYAPLYGLTGQQTQTQPQSLTGHQGLDNILQAGQ